MITPLIASIRDAVQRHDMFRASHCVAVAVSGGADSVALLRLLEDLRVELGFSLCVIHFNHQLRSHDSDEDERFVASLARDLNLPFFPGSADVASIAQRHKWNLEDAARRLRYRFFAKIIADGTAARVATAHTADDQAETVLARLIRGTGLTGLKAIHPVRGSIIRPLLTVRRAQLRSYLGTIGQEWREDSTNTDSRRLRARVRQQLMPQIEKDFSVAIVRNLAALADLARDDERFWAEIIEERCASIAARTPEAISIEIRDLLWPLGVRPQSKRGVENPFRAMTQRIVRHLYTEVAVSGGELSRRHVEAIIGLAEKRASGRHLELPCGVKVQRVFERLIFSGPHGSQSKTSRESSVPRAPYAHEIDVAHGSADVSVPELGRRFHLKVIDWPPQERETSFEGVILDAERLQPPLILRNWMPGDSYCPSGHRRRQRLARMLMANHVSAALRASWPVLTSAGRVAWADRMPVAKEFSATEATRRSVWIVEDWR